MENKDWSGGYTKNPCAEIVKKIYHGSIINMDFASLYPTTIKSFRYNPWGGNRMRKIKKIFKL